MTLFLGHNAEEGEDQASKHRSRRLRLLDLLSVFFFCASLLWQSVSRQGFLVLTRRLQQLPRPCYRQLPCPSLTAHFLLSHIALPPQLLFSTSAYLASSLDVILLISDSLNTGGPAPFNPWGSHLRLRADKLEGRSFSRHWTTLLFWSW